MRRKQRLRLLRADSRFPPWALGPCISDGPRRAPVPSGDTLASSTSLGGGSPGVRPAPSLVSQPSPSLTESQARAVRPPLRAAAAGQDRARAGRSPRSLGVAPPAEGDTPVAASSVPVSARGRGLLQPEGRGPRSATRLLWPGPHPLSAGLSPVWGAGAEGGRWPHPRERRGLKPAPAAARMPRAARPLRSWPGCDTGPRLGRRCLRRQRPRAVLSAA